MRYYSALIGSSACSSYGEIMRIPRRSSDLQRVALMVKLCVFLGAHRIFQRVAHTGRLFLLLVIVFGFLVLFILFLLLLNIFSVFLGSHQVL
jgi:hypothetical protein